MVSTGVLSTYKLIFLLGTYILHSLQVFGMDTPLHNKCSLLYDDG